MFQRRAHHCGFGLWVWALDLKISVHDGICSACNISTTKKSDSKHLIVCTCATGSATQLANLELKYFQTVAETPTK